MSPNRWIFYGVAGLSIATLAALMARRRLPAGLVWAVALSACAIAAARPFDFAAHGPGWGDDHRIFWEVGREVRAGIDPYEPSRFVKHPFLNPPSSLPLFEALSIPGLEASRALFAALNIALALALVPMARAILAAQGDRLGGGPGDDPEGIGAAGVALLAAIVALSDAVASGVELGQFPLVAAASILLALIAQSRGRAVLAGVALGFATVKVNTMLPFLLLFLRRRDLMTWPALGATVLVLIGLDGRPLHLLDDVRSTLRSIGEMKRPGGVNDISEAGPYNSVILGIDHALYRLGLRAPSALSAAGLAGIGGLGAWLAWVVVRGRVSRATAIGLVSLFATVFFYHRFYDTSVVAPALLLAADRARRGRGRARAAAWVAAGAMIYVLYLRDGLLTTVGKWSAARGGSASIVAGPVLASATLAVLVAMAALRLSEPPRPAEANAPDA